MKEKGGSLYNVSAAGVTGEAVAIASLADGKGGDGRAELRAAGADGGLAGLDLLDRVGEGWGGGQEHAEERGDGLELHIFCFRGVVVLVDWSGLIW